MIRNNYLSRVRALLAEIERTEMNVISDAADAVVEAIAADKLVWVFGSAHAGILTEELTFRAGGMACVSPLYLPGLTPYARPLTWSMALERIDEIAQRLVADVPIEAGDVMIVHSVSGRNTAPVEVALHAKERGATVIGLTSLEMATVSSPRSKTGLMLHQIAHIVLDNHVPKGDAIVALPNSDKKVSPASTVLGAAILHCVMAEAALRLARRGIDPPVFVSANVAGGDELNQGLLQRYRGRVWYL